MIHPHVTNATSHIREELFKLVQDPKIKSDLLASEYAFEQTWLKMYEEAKVVASTLPCDDKSARKQNILALYLPAIALLTTGRLDVAEDVLVGLEARVPFSLGLLGVSALGLIPYPRPLGKRPEFNSIRSWIVNNKPLILWNPEKGCYEYKKTE